MVMRLSAPVLGTAEGKGEGRQERKVLLTVVLNIGYTWESLGALQEYLHPTPDREGVQAPGVSKAWVFQ